MKVYILVLGENYEGYNIVGVYSSKELAEKEKRPLTSSVDYYDIEEWEIDKQVTE